MTPDLIFIAKLAGIGFATLCISRLIDTGILLWKERQLHLARTNGPQATLVDFVAPPPAEPANDAAGSTIDGLNRGISGGTGACGGVYASSGAMSHGEAKTPVRGLNPSVTHVAASIFNNGHTPADQAETFQAILAQGPVTSAEVREALDKLDFMERFEPEFKAVEFRTLASMLDRLAVERTDLALKLEEATRWERNPRRRPTLEQVKSSCAMLRERHDNEYLPPLLDAAALIESMAAELISSDRQRHELSQAAIAARSYGEEAQHAASMSVGVYLALAVDEPERARADKIVDLVATALGMVRS